MKKINRSNCFFLISKNFSIEETNYNYIYTFKISNNSEKFSDSDDSYKKDDNYNKFNIINLETKDTNENNHNPKKKIYKKYN